MKHLFLLLIGQSLVWAGIPIDGGWTPWAIESTIDCCMYGGFAQYTRTCTNPTPENGGKACFDLDSKWERCSCNCKLQCDGETAFCANETGNPAYCMCLYGKVYPTGVDPDEITYCVDPTLDSIANDSINAMIDEVHIIEPFTGNTKTIVNIVEIIVCGWVVAWCVATIIICAVFGNREDKSNFRAWGSHRTIHLMEELTLIVVYILVGYFAMNFVSNGGFCKVISALLHYVYMCTMTFFTLEALYAYSMVSGISPRDGLIHPAAINIVLGFGIPLIPFAAAFATLHDLYGGNGIHCWCDLKSSQAWGVFVPVVVLFFSGGILAEAIGLGEHPKLPDADQEQFKWSTNTKETLIGILLVSMFAYFIGIIAMDEQSVWVFGLFSAFNLLLGPAIFVCHTQCHTKVSTALNRMMPCLPFYKDPERACPENWHDPGGHEGVPPPISDGPQTGPSPGGGLHDKDADWHVLHAWAVDPNNRGDLQSQSEDLLFK